MRIELAALTHLGKRYGRRGRDTTDCVRFAYDVLTDAFGWDLDAERVLLINTGPWANVEHVAELGPGEVLLPVPGQWHLCQGWRGLDDEGIRSTSSGHCWFWYERLHEAEPSMILEATPATHEWYRMADWEAQIAKFDTVRLALLPLCD